MRPFTADELRTAADFLDSLNSAPAEVSIAITSPLVEVNGKTLGSLRRPEGEYVIEVG